MTMTVLTYHVLLALADGDRHGYGIIKEIEARAGESAAPSTGALYLALQRLEQEGWIEESPARPGPEHDDARRRYYRLTLAGRRAAEAESWRLATLLGVAVEKLLVPASALPSGKVPGGN
jgi:DNA-binding PadR family transcriptional regulator